MTLGLTTLIIEVRNNRIGKDLGIFSNLKIKKNKPSKINVEIITLFIIESISWSDAYLQIPRYKPMYFNSDIFINAKSTRKCQRCLDRLNALSKSSLTQRATKKENPKIIRSWSIVIIILKFTLDSLIHKNIKRKW